jgi:hypothetical protein
MLQGLLALVGGLVLSFCLFSCLTTLVRRLCETAVSPPHQMVMTTEVNLNDLTDLARLTLYWGSKERIVPTAIEITPIPVNLPFPWIVIIKCTFLGVHSHHRFV